MVDYARYDEPGKAVYIFDTSLKGVWRNEQAKLELPVPDEHFVGRSAFCFVTGLDDAAVANGVLGLLLRGKRVDLDSKDMAVLSSDGMDRKGVVEPILDGARTPTLFVYKSERVRPVDLTPSPHRRTWAHYLTGELNRSPRTALTYETNVARLEELIGKPAEEITVEDWRRFSRTTELKPRSKSGMFAALKSYLRFLTIEGLADRSPLLDVPGPKIITDEDDDLPPLTVDDARRVIAACKTAKDYRLVYLALYGGLRISEAESINETHWLEDRLRFTGKGRKKRSVPLHPELEKVRHVILSNPVEEKGLKHTAPSLSHATGIVFTAHTLRRTFSGTLREMRISTDVIAKLMGHAEKVTSQSYARVTWAEMVEAVSGLRY